MRQVETNVPTQLQPYLLLADAVVITNVNHKILAVNDEFERTTGYSKEFCVGLKPNFAKSNLTPAKTYVDMHKTLNEQQPWSGIFINRKKNGEFWHSSITITPFEIDGVIYFVGIFRALESLSEGTYVDERRKTQIQSELLRVLAISCEIRDPGIEEHLLSVQNLCRKLLLRHNQRLNLHLDEIYISNIINSSILHDIGKAGIPEGILYKPGRLAPYERMIIETHPLIGLDILKKISKEFQDELFTEQLEVSKNIILHHHEKWDGTGYPYQYKGEDIPFEARVVAIVDVYDALTSRRSYKEAWSKEKALNLLAEEKWKHFDGDLVDTMLKIADDL